MQPTSEFTILDGGNTIKGNYLTITVKNRAFKSVYYLQESISKIGFMFEHKA